jgi:hypothetical protein
MEELLEDKLMNYHLEMTSFSLILLNIKQSLIEIYGGKIVLKSINQLSSPLSRSIGMPLQKKD